ncbi:hypothetical protein [Verrucomicrobium spinosum]|nr:hypothetical protein [Verrucomicrobium spinosum]
MRQASRQHGVSITTVLQAYLALEDQGSSRRGPSQVSSFVPNS